jgi:hypothetical protein
LQTIAAEIAAPTVYDDVAENNFQRVFLAGGNTTATLYAKGLHMEQLWFPALGVRGGTPLAAQGTPLQEHNSPYAGTIVLRTSVYLKNHTFHT